MYAYDDKLPVDASHMSELYEINREFIIRYTLRIFINMQSIAIYSYTRYSHSTNVHMQDGTCYYAFMLCKVMKLVTPSSIPTKLFVIFNL